MMQEPELSFESAMERLEEIAAYLESGEVSLDESISLFEEANRLFRFCREKLRQAEEKLYILEREGNSFKEKLEE